MNIVALLRQEEGKLQKQINKLQEQLDAVRAAAKVLGGATVAGNRLTGGGKRVLSAAAKAKIAKAAKQRWAKYRAEKRKKEKAGTTRGAGA